MKFAMLVTPFVFFATAVNGAVVSRTDGPQCNSGTVQCCNTVGDAHSNAVQSLLGGLLGPIGALLPITGTVYLVFLLPLWVLEGIVVLPKLPVAAMFSSMGLSMWGALPSISSEGMKEYDEGEKSLDFRVGWYLIPDAIDA
ncbi:hypothetical protein DL96DRAFT_1554514 [Flagelloscypha sp. PMI_526]|nr:hypothetical protein DL96DRAFT_1554514 [Flagelloscypha sp. PMI_526]